MKEWRYSLRSALAFCLCSLLIFSTVFLNASITSNAAKVTVLEKSVPYYQEDTHVYGNTYLEGVFSEDFEYDDGDYEDDIFDFQYVLGKSVAVFTSDEKYYGYRLVFQRTSYETALAPNAIYSRWLCGTKTDLLNGSNVANYDDIKAERFAFYVPTDHAQVQILLAPLFYVDLYEAFSYDIGLTFDVTVEGFYTEAEYQDSLNSIGQKLDSQKQELEEQTQEMEEQTEEMKEQTNTQKGMLSKMSDFFNGFFDNLINSVIGLFVPSAEEMSGLFDSFMEFFNQRFGFLFYPFDCMIELVGLFLDSDSSDTTIVLPGFSIMGYTIWQDLAFDLTQVPVANDIFALVRTVTGSIIAFGFINYLRNYYEKRFGGGGS